MVVQVHQEPVVVAVLQIQLLAELAVLEEMASLGAVVQMVKVLALPHKLVAKVETV